MANLIILYWRDIPAQIIVRAGRISAKRELSRRFIEAIDRCAMKSKASESQAYLDEWRRGQPEACGDDLESEADAAAIRLEADYNAERLQALVDQQGRAG